MDWKVTVLKALQALGFVLLSAVVDAASGPLFGQALSELVAALLSAIPAIGGPLALAAKPLVLAVITAGLAALRNWLKHRNG